MNWELPNMEYFAEGSPTDVIDETRASALLDRMLEKMGTLRRVLIVPPDGTRFYSWAGELTCMLYQKLTPGAKVAILPALGTHFPMTEQEIARMYPGIPFDRFYEHDWRNDLSKLGEVPSTYLEDVSEGKLDYSIDCAINKLLVEEKWDRIISVGQLVPHEVIGIANYNKNIFVGVGGFDTINKSHYLGAVYGMERIMGQPMTPVRAVFDYCSEHFVPHLPITYLLTVRAKNEQGKLITRGLYAGDGPDTYLKGAELAREVNLDYLEKSPKKVVVYLDPHEFKSTWLGNKSIYRTRMAIADEGELIVLAPGVGEFGEDPEIDRLIRKYGYRGTPNTLEKVKENADLANNLSAAAHLIHGSSEGRFNITYCPGKLTREEVEGVGFKYDDLATVSQRYNPNQLKDGWNTMPDGEEIFYVSNPGLGLWVSRERFKVKT